MKRMFVMVICAALLASMAGTASAEMRGVNYSGYVTTMTTHRPNDNLYKSGYGTVISDTVTYFRVYGADGSYMGYERIENGGEIDLSAMIAVVGEAFTSGAVVSISKLVDVPDYILKEERTLYEAYREKTDGYRYDYDAEIADFKRLSAEGQITIKEYIERKKEVDEKYNYLMIKLRKWYYAELQRLRDIIARYPGKLISVSLGVRVVVSKLVGVR